MTQHPLLAFPAAMAEAFAATGSPHAARLADLIRGLAGIAPNPLEATTVPGCRFLEEACANAPAGMAAAASAIGLTAAHLDWREAPGESVPAHFRGKHAYVELAGPDGHFPATDFRCGIYLQAPDINYPSHAHAAEELYLIVSGTPLWKLDDDPWEAQCAGTLIRHHSDQPHAMETGETALLALWGWQGDIGFESYRFV